VPRPARRLHATLAGSLAALALLAGCTGGSSSPTQTVAAASDSPAAPAPAPAAEPPTTISSTPSTEAPAPTTVPTTKKAPATTVPKATATTAAPTAPTTTPPTTAAPAAPKVDPRQRIPFTTAAVQAAATAIRQRIPLFAPTDEQLRTFADAACTSFDQGQSKAQVQAAVSQAVSYVQGASLSAADAEFMVRTVVQLRCPGYLS
jgi:uncharacterized iron-regulated membrane protein